MWQLLNPFPLGVIQSFLKPIDDDFVGSFGLPVSLGISWVEYLFVIPSSEQYLLKALLSNWSSLSEIRVQGTLNRVTMFLQTNLLASTYLMLASGLASTHLVK